MPSRRAQRRDRTQGRYARRAHVAHGVRDYGVIVGWCATEDDLPELRQKLHDQLVTLMGARRRGGVSWTWWTGDDARTAVSKMIEGEQSLEHLNHYRRLIAHLREWDGWICMARAEGTLA